MSPSVAVNVCSSALAFSLAANVGMTVGKRTIINILSHGGLGHLTPPHTVPHRLVGKVAGGESFVRHGSRMFKFALEASFPVQLFDIFPIANDDGGGDDDEYEKIIKTAQS